MERFGEAIIASRHPAHSPEWYAARRESVGASEVAGVLGLGDPRYSSPAKVWAEKVGDELSFTGNVATEIGTKIERAILDRFGVVMRRAFWRGDALQLRHADTARLAANLDGWVGILQSGTVYPVPVEAKRTADHHGHATKQWDALEAWLSGDGGYDAWARTQIEGYYVQVQAQIAIVGAEYGYLVGCIGGEASTKLLLGMDLDDKEFRVLKIPRNDALIQKMVVGVEAFWTRYVEANRCPPVTEHDYDAIHAARRQATAGKEIHRRDLRGLVRSMQREQAKEARARQRIKAIKARLLAEVGDAETLHAGDITVTAKTQARKGYTRVVKPSVVRAISIEGKKK